MWARLRRILNKMKWNVEEIRKIIRERIPEGSVVLAHNERGHFYKPAKGDNEPMFPSVTGRLQVLKDESLINYKMNRALEYVFKNYPGFDDKNIMTHMEAAERMSADIFEDAGDIGRDIHDYRQKYFNHWIKTGKRLDNILNFIPPDKNDIRAVSALRALEQFVINRNYRPIITELPILSLKLKVGGTLDDLGLMDNILRIGDPECEHEIIESQKTNFSHCVKCDRKIRTEFVLMDLKTSNALKDHYFFQVSLYYEMFRKLTNLKPERCFILKLSKEDGTYKIEDLKRPGRIARYARSMLITNEGIDFIKNLRKDNQKVVLKI